MKKKIEILVDGRWFDSYSSGVTTYLNGIYNALALDPDFSITVVGGNIAKLGEVFPKNVTVIELKSASKIKWLYWDIPRLISKYGFDYAHFQYICPPARKCKYIVTLHDVLFLDFKEYFPLDFIIRKGLLFYCSARRADILITVSDFSKQRISHHFGIDCEKIHVIPNGILESYLDPSPVEKVNSKYEIDKYILFVSRIEPRKNHLALLEAFVDLGLYEEYHLVFVGKETIRVRKMERYLGRLPVKIKNRVVFIDNLSERELKSFYAHASLFVYPSISEGFGIPPIEAICSGAKTISSNTTALGDLRFLSEYQFDPTNLSELKNRLLYALNDANYPIDRFREIIRAQYSWKKMGERFKQVVLNDWSS